MNIVNYTGYFHDGSLIDIKHQKDCISLFMISSEVFPEDLKDAFPLALDNGYSIRGKLILDNVQRITVNDSIFTNHLHMFYDESEILDLNIRDDEIQLNLLWQNYRAKSEEKQFMSITIKAGNINWENIQDLVDPYSRTEPPVGYSGNLLGIHYHRFNPQANSFRNKYLNKDGVPVEQGSISSRLTPPHRHFLEEKTESSLSDTESIPLAKYSGYFHDGVLFDISTTNKIIKFKMMSSELDAPLSNDHRIKGVLCFEEIKEIYVNNKKFSNDLRMKYEVADIYNFEISKKKSRNNSHLGRV